MMLDLSGCGGCTSDISTSKIYFDNDNDFIDTKINNKNMMKNINSKINKVKAGDDVSGG